MTKLKYRRIGLAGLTVAALAVTAGCSTGTDNNSGDSSNGESGGGGTIVFQMGSDPNIINPTMSTGFADQQLGCTIFEGLTMLDPEGVPIPKLASSWDISDDGLEYTFHLEEANWQDGEPFTSEDVKFTYENFSSKVGPLWSDLSRVLVGVDTPDDRTAVIKLSEPFAPIVLMTDCGHNGAIIPKHIYEGVDPAGSEIKDVTPIGTGPFMLTKSTPGQSYELDANTDYWRDGMPKADKLVAQVIPDAASAVTALKAGEIDYINIIPSNSAAELEAYDGVEVRTDTLGIIGTQLMFFNTQREPFNNPEVRKALYQALDRDYIIDKVFFGRGTPGASAIGDGNWAYAGTVDYKEMYPYDVEAAAAALDAAGYPEVNGTRFSLNLLVRNDPPERIQLGNVMAAMWDQIGVDVTVTVAERAVENVAAFQDFDFDVNIQGYGSYGDPTAGTARVYICSSIGLNFGNPSQYCDPELDALWTAAAKETDIDARVAIFGEIDEAVAEVLPVAPIAQIVNSNARRSNLQGFLYQGGSPDWAGSYLE